MNKESLLEFILFLSIMTGIAISLVMASLYLAAIW